MFTVLKLERGYDRKGGLLCKPQGKCKISSWEYDLEDLFRMQNDLNISIFSSFRSASVVARNRNYCINTILTADANPNQTHQACI